MQKLNDIDVKLLRFVKNNPSCDVGRMKEGLKDVDAIETRLQILHGSQYVRMDIQEVMDGALTRRIPLFTYQITDSGERELQDYDHTTKTNRRDLWLKNAWIPILVSFVTTVAANYILPKLPLLIEWFRRILAKSA